MLVYLSSGTVWLDTVRLAADHFRLSPPNASLGPAGRALHPSASFDNWRRTYVAGRDAASRFYLREDAHATVVAHRNGGQTVLVVNGKTDASTVGDLQTQILLAHFPLFTHPNAESLLLVGYGSGITLGSALRHPLQRVDVVEISRAMIDADYLFAASNHHALDDARVRIYEDDAQSFLRTVPRRYDVIISQPTNPWIAGVAGLFTVEYFQSIRDRLNSGGVAAIWFHQYEQSDNAIDLVLRTLRSVFSHVHLFSVPDGSDIVAVATSDFFRPSFAAMERRFERPAARDDLARIEVTSLVHLLALHVVSPERLEDLIQPGPLNTTGHQLLEYAAPRSLFHGEDATFLQRARSTTAATLLDAYVAHRRTTGSALPPEQISAARKIHPPQQHHSPPTRDNRPAE